MVPDGSYTIWQENSRYDRYHHPEVKLEDMISISQKPAKILMNDENKTLVEDYFLRGANEIRLCRLVF